MFCLFSVLAQAQGGVKCRITGSAGGVRILAVRPSGPALHAGSGASGWGMGHQPADAGEVGFIFPVGIAWLLSLVYSCPSRVFQLPFAVRQPLLVYLGGSLSLAYGADLSGLLPALAFLFKVPDTGFARHARRRPGLVRP